MREQVIKQIREEKIIAIVRGVDAEKAVKAARALYNGGIKLVEVTYNLNDPDSYSGTAEAIRSIKKEMDGKMLVGAGTVTSTALVELAAQAGAEYIISPDTDEAVIHKTLELGLVSLPGAFTATEAKRAHEAGADFVKIFPCVGYGPEYIKALCAPLNHICFLAVGGVSAENAADFLKAGAVGVGVGGSLVNRKWIESGNYERVTEQARRFVANVNL